MSRQGDFFKNCYANKALVCAAWLFCKTANQGLSKTIGEVKKVWEADKKDPKNALKMTLETYNRTSNVRIAGALSTHDYSKFSWDRIQEFLILKLGDPSTNAVKNSVVDHISKGSVKSKDPRCLSTGQDHCYIPDGYQMKFCA